MSNPTGDHGASQSPLSITAAADRLAQLRASPQNTPTASPQATEQARPPLEESPVPEPVDALDSLADTDADSPEQPADGPQDGVLTLTDDAKVRLPDGTELTGVELRRGMLREADYTRKTQALAEQRSTLEQTVQALSFHLGTLRQQGTAELQKYATTDWAALFQKDPNEYQAARLRYEQAQQRMTIQQQAEKDFLDQLQKVQSVEKRQRVEEATKYLAENYPNGWSDGEYNSLMDYAVSQGWRRDSVATWDDPLVFMMLRKAKAFDEAQRVSTKKVVPATGQKTLRSTRGAAPKPTGPSREDMAARIRKSGTGIGSIQEAAAMLGELRRGPSR